jgi:hypothetical protein
MDEPSVRQIDRKGKSENPAIGARIKSPNTGTVPTWKAGCTSMGTIITLGGLCPLKRKPSRTRDKMAIMSENKGKPETD